MWKAWSPGIVWSRQRRSKAEILYGSAPANGFGQDHWRSHSPGARPPTRLLLPALRSPCLCLLAIGIAGFGSFRSGANRLFAFGICKPSFDGHAVTQCSHCSASYNRCCRQRAPWLWPSGKNCISGETNFQRMRSFRVGRETKNAPGHRPVLESTLDLLAARHAPTPHRRCPGLPAGKRAVCRKVGHHTPHRRCPAFLQACFEPNAESCQRAAPFYF